MSQRHDDPQMTQTAKALHAQDRLREASLRMLVENLADYALILLDPRGYVTTWNAGAERIKGFAAEEILGQHFSRFYAPEDVAAGRPERLLEQATRTGRAEDESWRVRKDGTRFWANAILNAVHDDAGELIGFAKITRDLSEKRQAEEQRQRMLRDELQAQALQAANRRSEFLAAASATLTSSLDYVEMLRRVAHLAVEDVADWVTVVVKDRAGQLQRVAVVHRDAAKERAVAAYGNKFDPSRHTKSFMDGILAEGRAVVRPHIGDEEISAWAQDKEHEAVLRELGMGSAMVVPIRSGSEVLGMMSLVRERQSAPYQDADVALGEDLAGRAALAIERARLYEAEREARAVAQAERDRLHDILMALPAAVSIKSVPELRYLLVNPPYETLSGGGEVVGKTFEQVFPDRGPEHLERHRDVIRTGQPQKVVEYDTGLPAPGADHSRIVDSVLLPLRNREGTVDALLSFTLDVTDKVRAREELRRRAERSRFLAEASQLLSSSLDLLTTSERIAHLLVPRFADWCQVQVMEPGEVLRRIVTLHVDPAKVQLANELAERYPPKPDAPYGVHAVVRSGQPSLIHEIPDALLESAAQSPEHLEILRSVGMRSAMTVPMRGTHGPFGAITLIAAESGRLYDAEDLAFAQELADRAALALENARLYDEAQRAIRIRDDFLSVASHELRTPLTGMQLQLQRLMGHLRDEKDAHRVEVLGRQIKRLTRLVDELLDVSRISSGRLPLSVERFDLTALTAEVVDRFREQADQVKSELRATLKDAAVGEWDRMRVDQILTNLLSNALKFGAGRPVDVVLEQQSGEVAIAVSDQGIGVAAEDQQRIFEQFERAVPVNHFGGMGLGLWVSRELALAMGGDIEVKSAKGQGATFTVRLPLRPDPAE